MRVPPRWTFVVALATFAAGCGPAANDPAQGGVTAKEAQALNDAAAALEDNGSSDAVISTNATDPDPVAENSQ